MKCKPLIISAAIAVVLGAAAQTAWAFPPSNPALPTGADIISMFEETGGFSNNQQLSTQTKTNKPDGSGFTSNAQFRVGTGGLGGGETFSRIVFTQFFGNPVGSNRSLNDGVQWMITSTVPVAVKPYTQTNPGFAFYEGNQPSVGCGAGVICVPANVPTPVSIDWNMVGAGSIPLAERANIFKWGFQIFGPSPPVGQAVEATIMVTTAVPEPGAMALLGFAGLALVGLRTRLRRE